MYFGFEPLWPFDFRPVAQVLEGDLEEVFRLTQDFDLSERDEALVNWLVDSSQPRRSTAVGDVVMVNNGEVTRTWLCTHDGWGLVIPHYDC
jgi:hypothetical protein